MAFLLNSQRKVYLANGIIYPNTMAWGPQRHGAQCSCIGLRPVLILGVLQSFLTILLRLKVQIY